jgi:hypothetical protein
VPDVFDPTPQTRPEQAAEQQARVSAASTKPWGQEAGVKRQGFTRWLCGDRCAESEVYGFVGDTL